MFSSSGEPNVGSSCHCHTRREKGFLDMKGCEFVYVSPDRPVHVIHNEVRPRNDIETDSQPLINTLVAHCNEAQ